MNDLPTRMKHVRKERLSLRRQMFRFLRLHRNLIKDGRLIRKMNGNYMADLSDLSLINYTKKIMEAIENEN